MMFRSILFLSAALMTTSASAGYVQNYVDIHGGCTKDAGVLGLLLETSVPQTDSLFLDKAAATWTDEDVEEYRKVLEACIWVHPAWIMTSFVTGGPDVPPPGAIEATVDRRVNEVLSKAIEPARAARRQAEAKVAARQALDADREQSQANAEREQLRQRQAVTDAQRVRAHDQEEQRRAVMREQARQDREAATQAKALAEQEAPQIAATEQEASEAHKARLAAEKHLDEVRQQVASAQDQRASDNAAVAAAKASRLRMEADNAKRKRERQEDEALAQTCAVSSSQFGRVALGMSLREVRKTFGCVGSMTTSTEIQGLGTLSVFEWAGTRMGTSAITTFDGDRLISKTQTALE